MFDFTQIELALSAPSLFLRLLKPFIWLAKTSWLAGWLADWLVGPLGCYCTMPMAWIMHIDLWSPLTDSPKHSAQLNSTELNWAELNSSQVESSQRCLLPSAGGASIVVVAVVDLSQHLFFSLALLTINKKRKCKRRKPNSIELKTENN